MDGEAGTDINRLREWLAFLLLGKTIRARYTYAREGGEVETGEIKEVDAF